MYTYSQGDSRIIRYKPIRGRDHDHFKKKKKKR